MSRQNETGRILRWNSLNCYVTGVIEEGEDGQPIVRIDNGHTMRLEDISPSVLEM